MVLGKYPQEPAIYFIKGVSKDVQNRIRVELDGFNGTLAQLYEEIKGKIPDEEFLKNSTDERKLSPRSLRNKQVKLCNSYAKRRPKHSLISYHILPAWHIALGSAYLNTSYCRT